MPWRPLHFAIFLVSAGLVGCASRLAPATATATQAGIQSRTQLPLPPENKGGDAIQFPPGIQAEQPLSSDDAAAIALWNQPQLRADLASLGIARGDLIDAGLLRNPRLDMLLPVGPKPFELILNLPIEVLWQRKRRVAASQKAYDQLAQSLIQNGLNTVRDARLAHADLALAIAREKAGQQSVTLRERIASLTEARLKAGDISDLEAMAARSDAASVREQLLRLQHDVALATERLRMALGLALHRSAITITIAPIDEAPPPQASELVGKALEARPDLRAAEIAIAAAAERARWQRSQLGLVAAQLSSKGVGTNGILTGPGLSAELPIFHQNQGLRARADAEVAVASRQYLAIKQRVAFEVYESRELLVQAQDALHRLRQEVLPPLQKTVALAEEQYQKGDVAYLFVLEQSRGLIDAELRLADAEVALRRAQALLDRNVGTK
ncbi:TolC family protein [Bryobacter aggregatus]|uniref:TolC family protein n=1 Tax=Bryobacter aggregatus TaxID=360054 RepID=UPI00068C99A1|nr:TolC family protein [Bryobacter aggregatus]